MKFNLRNIIPIAEVTVSFKGLLIVVVLQLLNDLVVTLFLRT